MEHRVGVLVTSNTFCFVSICVDSKGLSNPGEVEALREGVYASLEAYCKHKYPGQPGRYWSLFGHHQIFYELTSY